VFKWLRRSRKVEEEHVASVFVLFETVPTFDLVALAHQAIERHPAVLRDGRVRENGSTVSIDIANGAVGLSAFDGRLELIDSALSSGNLSVLAGAELALETYRSALLVTAGCSALSQSQLAVLVSDLALFVTDGHRALGAFVLSSSVACCTNDFRRWCSDMSPDNLPLVLWLGVRPFENAGRLSACSKGLTAFGLQELVVGGSGQDLAELAAYLYDLAHYQIQSGGALQAGETFGFNENQRVEMQRIHNPFVADQNALYFEV
jgi:hypothetical protein